MRVFIGVGFVIACLVIFGWWGLLSFLVALPFIGWKDRHKGPFWVQKEGTTDWEGGAEFCEKYPNSSKLFQDLLVNISDNQHEDQALENQLNKLLQLLKNERYTNSTDSNRDALIGFLNQFSALFPNWKPEYKKIFEEIKRNFYV